MKKLFTIIALFLTTITFGQEYWKYNETTDSIEVGSEYRAYIEIDTTKVKDLDKVSVYLWKAKVDRTSNLFPFSFAIFLKEPLKCDVTIIYGSDTTKFQKIIYGIKPKNPKPSISVVPIPEVMPEFKSKTFNSFDDYILKTLNTENIVVKGKLILTYTIMTDGTIAEIKVHCKALNYFEKDKVAIIIANGNNWVAGKDKGKNVNVPMQTLFEFK